MRWFNVFKINKNQTLRKKIVIQRFRIGFIKFTIPTKIIINNISQLILEHDTDPDTCFFCQRRLIKNGQSQQPKSNTNDTSARVKINAMSQNILISIQRHASDIAIIHKK